MQFFAFGLTVAHPPIDDAEFFGQRVELEGTDELAVFGVPAHGQPASTEEMLVEFDRVIRDLAAIRTVLPHRFGVITSRSAIVDDLVRHGDLFSGALTELDGRDEWVVRVRPRADDVLSSLPATSIERIRSHEHAVERGAVVHDVMSRAATQLGEELADRLREVGRPATVARHDDGLGADVVALIERAPDVVADVGAMTAGARRRADVELIGPGPAYRTAGMLTGRLLSREEMRR